MTLPDTPLTLILADDHAIVRMGFRLLLEGVGAHVLAEAVVGGDAKIKAISAASILASNSGEIFSTFASIGPWTSSNNRSMLARLTGDSLRLAAMDRSPELCGLICLCAVGDESERLVVLPAVVRVAHLVLDHRKPLVCVGPYLAQRRPQVFSPDRHIDPRAE